MIGWREIRRAAMIEDDQTRFKGLPSSDPTTDLMATRDGLALVKAFMRISNMQLRRRIVDLVEEIEEHQD
jgi:hypothetical protein